VEVPSLAEFIEQVKKCREAFSDGSGDWSASIDELRLDDPLLELLTNKFRDVGNACFRDE
jgi:hypothetical protein